MSIEAAVIPQADAGRWPSGRGPAVLALSVLLHVALTWQLLAQWSGTESHERVISVELLPMIAEPPPVVPPRPVVPPPKPRPPRVALRIAPPQVLAAAPPPSVAEPPLPDSMRPPASPTPPASVESSPRPVELVTPGSPAAASRGVEMPVSGQTGPLAPGSGAGGASPVPTVIARPGPPAPAGPAITETARPRGGYQVRPEYPLAARDARAEGTTLLRVFVQADGRVGEVTVQRSAGHTELDEAASKAVARWRFEPARSGNEPVAVWVQIPVVFRLTAE